MFNTDARQGHDIDICRYTQSLALFDNMNNIGLSNSVTIAFSVYVLEFVLGLTKLSIAFTIESISPSK